MMTRNSTADTPRQADTNGPSPLEREPYRWLPLVWQIAGTLLTVGGYVVGTLTIVEVMMHVALLSFFTSIYLSIVVRNRRRLQDTAAIIGFLLYAAGLGFVSAPNLALGAELTTPTRTLGGLFFGLLLVLMWVVYVEYTHPDPRTDGSA